MSRSGFFRDRFRVVDRIEETLRRRNFVREVKALRIERQRSGASDRAGDVRAQRRQRADKMTAARLADKCSFSIPCRALMASSAGS